MTSKVPNKEPDAHREATSTESASFIEHSTHNEQASDGQAPSNGRLKPISGRFRPQPAANEIGNLVSREDVSFDMPTCSLSSRDLKDAVLRERLDDAIKYGRDYMPNRYALYKFKASHTFLTRTQTYAFGHELKLLTHVLTSPWCDRTRRIILTWTVIRAYVIY